MLSLLELIAQNQPHFKTHPALLILGVQNDFLQADGKIAVNTKTGFLDRINNTISSFRQQSANIIWVKTVYSTDRLANNPATGEGDSIVLGGLVDGVESSSDDDDDDDDDQQNASSKGLPMPAKGQQQSSKSSKHRLRALDLLKRVSSRKRPPVVSPRGAHAAIEATTAEATEEDEELFLRQSAKKGPSCEPGTLGGEFADPIRSRMVQADTVVETTSYSAFQGTSLLLILRARLVTELFICGSITNVNVLATVVDAARHGIKINVVGDCLGFRKRARHDLALKRMVELFDANILTSDEVLQRDHAASTPDPVSDLPLNKSKTVSSQHDGRENVDSLRQSTSEHRLHTDKTNSPVHGKERVELSAAAAAAQDRSPAQTFLSDERFAENLEQGAKVHRNAVSAQGSSSAQDLVKSSVRMRSRARKSKNKNKKGADDVGAEPASTNERRAAMADSTPQATAKTQDVPEQQLKTSSSPSVVTKAGSSDKLRAGLAKGERLLKSSASHPILSTVKKEKENSKDKQPKPAMATISQEMMPVPSATSTSAPDYTKVIQPTESASTIAMANTARAGKTSKLQSLATFPTLGPGDPIAEGESRIIYDFFPPKLCHPYHHTEPIRDLVFKQLYNEVKWQKMLHQQGEVPRLVCCQGEFGADGSMPVYRHPTDQVLPLLHFSSKVQLIRRRAEKLVGHPLNHVLIQLYRSGQDFISEHSDKSLDIVKGSSIVNISFGAQRTMRLRAKKASDSGKTEEPIQRETQRVAMPHNSMFVLGLKSNEKWLHGIMADKRLQSERSEAETAYSGMRISLTFRHIGTFLDAKSTVIWGQGATNKDQREASDVINNDYEESESMVRAFSHENHDSDFDWDAHYGSGFDVLHLHAPPPELPILFLSNNTIENNVVKLYLAEAKIPYTLYPAPDIDPDHEHDRQITYRDIDVNHTVCNIAIPIMFYLDRWHPLDTDDRGRICSAASITYMINITTLMKYWVNRHVPTYLADFAHLFEGLEEQQAFGPGPFISGRRFAFADCVMWPTLDDVIKKWIAWDSKRFPALAEYHQHCLKKRKSVQNLQVQSAPATTATAGDKVTPLAIELSTLKGESSSPVPTQGEEKGKPDHLEKMLSKLSL